VWCWGSTHTHKEEKIFNDDDTIDVAVGLIKYPIYTEKGLKLVAGNPPDSLTFQKTLTQVGVPRTVCDVLFEQYLAPKRKTIVTLRMKGKKNKKWEIDSNNRTLDCLEMVAREQFDIGDAKIGFFYCSARTTSGDYTNRFG
jgi:hypothetical protein